MEEKLKNEKKCEFKGNLGVVWLIGILVILLGCTVGYIFKLNNEMKKLKQTTVVEEQPNQEQAESEGKKTEDKKDVKKIDTSKELVYTYASKQSEKDDYSFEIPYVNIDSDYAKEINKKIEKDYSIDKLVKEAKEAPDVLRVIEYKVYINNNILSLVITEGYAINTEYFAYNIDIYTGEKISNEQILKNKNISENNFLSKVEELCIKAVNEIYKNNKDNSKQKSINTTIKENKNMKINMFLDNNNKINIISMIYNGIAQITETREIINTNL